MRRRQCGDQTIYAGLKEKKGYEQFYRVILSDYYSLLIREDKYAEFSDYAKALGVQESELLNNIRLTCFYMSNASIKDTKGKINNRVFMVSDEALKNFYEWVIENDLKMPEAKPILVETDDSVDDGDETDSVCFIAGFRKFMEDKKKAKDLLGGVQLYEKYLNYLSTQSAKNPKQYPDILLYGEKRALFYEMLSARTIMRAGAVEESREVGTLYGVTGSLALISKDESGQYESIKALARTTNDLVDDDLLLAQALLTVPNRIMVYKKDIEEYKNLLLGALKKNSVGDLKNDKVCREFLMALGYHENDGIIRMQCQLFDEKLPRILQYVIYCKVYESLGEIVQFYDNDIRSPECFNVSEINDKYEAILENYGIKGLDSELQPVKDVLIDYRPYIKAVPYYQGIKPEFLCRMLNEIIRLGNKKDCIFNDGFGGSGTISLNLDTTMNMSQEYNDLGAINEAFFKELKNERGRALKERMSKFIKLILIHSGDEELAKEFLEPYKNVLEKIEIPKYGSFSLTKLKLAKIEDKYQEEFNSNVEKRNGNSEKKQPTLNERLEQIEKKYQEIFKESYQEVDIKKLREIEKYLHAFMLIFNIIYDELKDEDNKAEARKLKEIDLAFLFMIYHFLSHRHFYNDATFDKFAKLIGSYEYYIDNASRVAAEIEIHCGDAVELAKSLDKEGQERVFYFDIPYSETDISNYSSEWFDEKEFVDFLNESKSDYIVSSRYNICNGRQGGLDTIENEKKKSEKDIKLSNKEKNVVKFFMRFVSEEFAQQYESDIKEISSEEDNERDAYNGKEPNPWSHIAEDRAAKYIIFAFTNTEQKLGDNGKTAYVKNHMPVSKESICRMLKNTQDSNIEVEIMLTNMDLKALPVQEISEKDGIWCIPAFKTKSSYKIEPVIIILNYKEFIKDMVFSMISEHQYMTIEAKNVAAFFRDRYR